MKDSLLEYKLKAYCYNCNRYHFFIDTPSGADYQTCPNCTYEADWIDNDDEDQIKYYCPECNILFDFSHTHRVNGCTDDNYNALFITRYMYNDVIYEKIPVFDSLEECKSLLNSDNFKILDETCTCNNRTCHIKHTDRLFQQNFALIPETIGCKQTFNYKNKQIIKIQRWFKKMIIT